MGPEYLSQMEGRAEEVCHESSEKVEMLESTDVEMVVSQCGGCN